jgi:hypothetical protein
MSTTLRDKGVAINGISLSLKNSAIMDNLTIIRSPGMDTSWMNDLKQVYIVVKTDATMNESVFACERKNPTAAARSVEDFKQEQLSRSRLALDYFNVVIGCPAAEVKVDFDVKPFKFKIYCKTGDTE